MQFLLWCIAATLLLGLRVHERYLSPDLKVTFFDVGQGDASLIQFPHGETWMVDAGGGWKDWNWGQRVLYLELARKGIFTLNRAVISHPDRDHALGFHGLLPQVYAKALSWNGLVPPNPLLKETIALLIQHGGRPVPVVGEERSVVGGVSVHLFPIRTASPKENENPLILELEFQGCRFLLAGDSENQAENVLERVVAAPVDVLKVNHHGSRTSSGWGFVSRVRPVWAVVSVGVRNFYGHPAPSVLRRLSLAGARVLRTDRDGFVEFTVRSGQISCRAASGSCGIAKCAAPGPKPQQSGVF